MQRNQERNYDKNGNLIRNNFIFNIDNEIVPVRCREPSFIKFGRAEPRHCMFCEVEKAEHDLIFNLVAKPKLGIISCNRCYEANQDRILRGLEKYANDNMSFFMTNELIEKYQLDTLVIPHESIDTAQSCYDDYIIALQDDFSPAKKISTSSYTKINQEEKNDGDTKIIIKVGNIHVDYSAGIDYLKEKDLFAYLYTILEHNNYTEIWNDLLFDLKQNAIRELFVSSTIVRPTNIKSARKI
jgi:hypothetical protein